MTHLSLACALTFALPLLALPARPSLVAPGFQASSVAHERRVGILVYEGVELLDFAGPGEVFSAVHGKDGHAFRVVTVAKEKRPILSQGFVRVTPEYSLADCPELDVLVLPGGNVPADDRELVEWVRARARTAECVMSVCNGAFLPARAGLLEGLEITSHHSAHASLAAQFPTVKVLTNRRFVDHGRVMTCAGVSAGIDGALHLVARLVDLEAARATARYMEYDWRPEELAALHAQPGQPVGENPLHRVARVARESGLAAGAAALAELRPEPGEPMLGHAAWSLVGLGKAEEARALLELSARLHGESPRPLEALSDLCERLGKKDEALEFARGALQRLDGGRHGASAEEAALVRNAAASRLARLGGDGSKLRFVCDPCEQSCDERRYLSGGVCPQCRMRLVEVEQ